MIRQPTQLGNVAVSLLSTQPLLLNVIDTNQMFIWNLMKKYQAKSYTVLICFGTRSETVEPETKPNYFTSYKDCINKS